MTPTCSPVTVFMRRRAARGVFVGLSAAALVLAASACGSSDDSTDAARGAEADVTVDATEPVDTGESAIDDGTGGSDGSGAGTLTIDTDTGEAWELQQETCTYTPDAEGDLVELWGASADVPSGGGFVVSLFSTDPSDPAALGQYSGALYDEARGIAYTVANGDAESDGTTMTMTLGMYATNEWELGDPIDLTATVTCEL